MYEFSHQEIGESIHNHLVVFEKLIARATDYLEKCRYEAAAVYAQLAADYAWRNHPGLFVSPQLENILLAIGRKLAHPADDSIRETPDSQSPQRILHVLTQAYSFGGHTKLACKWMQEDVTRAHSIALTRQGRRSLPHDVEQVVSDRRGQIHLLDERPGGLLSRAALLRQIAQSYDQIVLHIHPYDVVPTLAFANDHHAPVIFMNHADHVFWVGASVSDVIAHFRESGLRASLERRGLSRDCCSILPIPLLPKSRTLSRAEAKKQIGFDDSTVILLSVAVAYKYESKSGTSFVKALAPVIQKCEQSVLLAVGPDDSGQWAEGKQLTHGRIKALGVREDPSLFYQAADIYLDSFPFSSLTSLLEAASYGIPVVGYHAHPAVASVLQADDPAVPDQMLAFSNLGEYQNAVLRLIADEKLRRDSGNSVKKSVLEIHTGAGWMRFLEQLYLQAATVSPSTRPLRLEETSISDLDRALSWMHANNGFSQGLGATIREHSRLLPLRPRVKVWADMCKEKRRLLPFFLLSESVGTHFERKIWR